MRSLCDGGIKQARAIQMAVQALFFCQRRRLLHILKRQQFAAQRVFQRQQPGAREVRVVGLDGRLDVGQGQAAVGLVIQRLRLHAAKHRRAAAFPTVAVRHLPDDVFVTALAMGQNRAQVALGAGGHKQGGFKTQQAGDFFLQGIDAGVTTKHVVAQWGRQHGRTHGRRGLGHGIAA